MGVSPSMGGLNGSSSTRWSCRHRRRRRGAMWETTAAAAAACSALRARLLSLGSGLAPGQALTMVDAGLGRTMHHLCVLTVGYTGKAARNDALHGGTRSRREGGLGGGGAAAPPQVKYRAVAVSKHIRSLAASAGRAAAGIQSRPRRQEETAPRAHGRGVRKCISKQIEGPGALPGLAERHVGTGPSGWSVGKCLRRACTGRQVSDSLWHAENSGTGPSGKLMAAASRAAAFASVAPRPHARSVAAQPLNSLQALTSKTTGPWDAASVAALQLSCSLLCEDVCGAGATAAAGGEGPNERSSGLLASCADDTNTAGQQVITNMSWN